MASAAIQDGAAGSDLDPALSLWNLMTNSSSWSMKNSLNALRSCWLGEKGAVTGRFRPCGTGSPWDEALASFSMPMNCCSDSEPAKV